MNVKSVFGSNLKLYRKKKDLSQEQLSEKLDISVKHLSEIERGIVFASAGLLEKLAENLDIPIFAFFLTGDSVFYNNSMLDRIEKMMVQNSEQTMKMIVQNSEQTMKMIVQNIEQTMKDLKAGHFQ